MQFGPLSEIPLRVSTMTCLIASAAAVLIGMLQPDAHAQSSSTAIPDNARQRSYGSGWQCNRGYRETVGKCVAVLVPADAYLSPDGSSWTCNRGFRSVNDTCTAVVVPA